MRHEAVKHVGRNHRPSQGFTHLPAQLTGGRYPRFLCRRHHNCWRMLAADEAMDTALARWCSSILESACAAVGSGRHYPRRWIARCPKRFLYRGHRDHPTLIRQTYTCGVSTKNAVYVDTRERLCYGEQQAANGSRTTSEPRSAIAGVDGHGGKPGAFVAICVTSKSSLSKAFRNSMVLGHCTLQISSSKSLQSISSPIFIVPFSLILTSLRPPTTYST